LDRIAIVEKAGRLSFLRKGATERNLVFVGDRAFHPVGASAVRIRFAGSGADTTLTVHDPDVVVTARRMPPAG
jgi:hypothetical protein